MEINVTKNILEPRPLKKWTVTVVLYSNLILYSALKNIGCKIYIKLQLSATMMAMLLLNCIHLKGRNKWHI